MTVMSLFTGIGGFELGLEPLGFKIMLQVEKDRHCLELLEKKWPNTRRIKDVREIKRETADVVCGGDPCPTRSRARGHRASRHPDLAGYYLAVVARSSARWVVRENVPAPDIVHFAAGLEAIGYGVVTFALDARDFTSQSRRREFVVAGLGGRAARFKQALFDAADGFGFSASRPEETTPVAACVTAHPARLAAEDSYCFEPCTDAITATQPPGGWETGNYLYDQGRLRVLTPAECEALQGFPRGWTAGFSRSRRRIMLGRAVPPPIINWIGKRILEAERMN